MPKILAWAVTSDTIGGFNDDLATELAAVTSQHRLLDIKFSTAAFPAASEYGNECLTYTALIILERDE